MSTGKFPISYHTGTPEQFKNSAYNIYTAASLNQYTADGAIDFYTFKETSAADSPEQSFVVFIIKNTGSANSLLDINGIEIITQLEGNNQPFSLCTQLSHVTSGLQGDGLHTIGPNSLPSSITNQAGYVALGSGTAPTPLGFITIDNQEGDVNADSFGSTGTTTYVPFYSPDDIADTDNKIGATSHDYGGGEGTQVYPSYAAFVVKCDPQIRLEILAGQVVLKITQSTGTFITINLVMQSYNEGNLVYQQGWLTDATSGDPSLAGDAPPWSFSSHSQYSAITPITGPNGDANTPLSTVEDQAVVNPIPAIDYTIQNSEFFYLGFWPSTFQWNNKNNLFNGDVNKLPEHHIPCVKIIDDTATTGGVQFLHSGDNAGQFPTILTDTAEHQAGTHQDENNLGLYIVTSSSSQINFFQGAPGFSLNEIATLNTNEAYYLIWEQHNNVNSGSNLYQEFFDNINRPYINAVTVSGNNAWRAKVMRYPVYHKNWFINNSNNDATQVEAIQFKFGVYNCMGISQMAHSRLNNFGTAYVDTDGSFSYPGDVDSNYLNFDISAITETRTRYLTTADLDETVGSPAFAVNSYYKGMFSAGTYKGIIKDTQQTSITGPENAVSYSSSNGLKTIHKHLHVNDLFVIPNIEMDGASTTNSVLRPVVCWQNFHGKDDFYSRSFKWNSNYEDTFVTVDNATENPAEAAIVAEIVSGNDSTSNMIIPLMHATINTGGDESVANTMTTQSGEPGGTTSATVFSDSAGFETITVAGETLYQKSIRLFTRLQAGTLSNTKGFNYFADANNAMNWKALDSGDPIGRYPIQVKFTIKPSILIKASNLTNTNGRGYMNSGLDLGTPQKDISFSLWAYLWPKYNVGLQQGNHLSILNIDNKFKNVNNFYYTSYGAETSVLTPHSTYVAGDSVSTTHTSQLVQSLTIGNLANNADNATSLEYKYASVTPTDAAYYKKYALNGSGMFKYEKYFSSATDIQSVTSGSHSSHGILPGPRKQGRYGSGSAEPCYNYSTHIYKSDLALNSAAGTYETFIPIDFKIGNHDYYIQVVDIKLDNEMLSAVEAGTPQFQNPHFIQDVLGNTSDVFQVPYSDLATNPPAAPKTFFTVGASNITLSTSTAVVTIPNITVSGRTLAADSARVDMGADAIGLGIMVGQTVTSSTAAALANQQIVAGIDGNFIILSALPDQAATGQTLTFVTVCKNVGIRAGQNVISSTAADLPAVTRIASVSSTNEFTLDANPNQNGSSRTLTLSWQQPNYASWAMVYGSRAIGSTDEINQLKRGFGLNNFNNTRYIKDLVMPYQGDTYNTPELWDAEQWDGTVVYVGALDFKRAGRMEKPNNGSFETFQPTDSVGNAFSTVWCNFDKGKDYKDKDEGLPHIYCAIDRTKIEANNQDSLTLYNRVRIKYILHNKLDNYGVAQEDITGVDVGNSPYGPGHSFTTGGGDDIHVYEDVYLVKVNFEAVAPTLEVQDVEGDTAVNFSTIDFGIIHS